MRALRLAAPNTANKLLGLEALRFLTAFAILIFHYRHFAFLSDKPAGLATERLPFFGALQPFYDFGAFGVWIFWCISGFIFFWKYRDSIAERSVGGWKFFVLRFSRLYPLHLVMLLLVALLQPVYFGLHGCFFVYRNNDLPHFFAQLFMASDWGIVHGDSFDGPIWSISIEVMVYLLFFVMLLASRSWLLNAAVVMACVIADWLHASGQLTNCLAFFYVGGLAAMARSSAARTRFKPAIELFAWLAAVTIPPMVVSVAGDQLYRIDFPLFLTCTPILLFCLSREFSVPVSIQTAVEAAGNMTYSSYLLHFPLQLVMVIGFAIAGFKVPLYDISFFVLYLGTTLLASYFVYRYFEAPAQNLIRDYLLRGGIAAVPPALSVTK